MRGILLYWKGRLLSMGLNLKSSETHKLAQELAALTGESMAAAVNRALRDRLERIRPGGASERAARLLMIGRDCAAHLKEPYRTAEHGDLLYGEDGLPK